MIYDLINVIPENKTINLEVVIEIVIEDIEKFSQKILEKIPKTDNHEEEIVTKVKNELSLGKTHLTLNKEKILDTRYLYVPTHFAQLIVELGLIRIETVAEPSAVVAKSCLPSPLKSPMANDLA